LSKASATNVVLSGLMQPNVGIDKARLRAALEKATAALLAERNAQGFWEGELSSSALSTATAVTALALALKHGANPQSPILNPQSSIATGLKWLAENQNADGGWGDTTKSLSNNSTTTLCWAAFGAAGADEEFAETLQRARDWLTRASVPPASRRVESSELASAASTYTSRPGGTPGALSTDALARAIIARYGKDRTFSVPILTMCALAGRLGEGRAAWRHVIPLPFELAACPHQLFAALRLPVVSYALPALIAIGQARHVHAPSRNPIARMIRNAVREKTLRKLTEIQPTNGGFLEATPLTSFVTMSLAGSGRGNHVVTQRGLEFLLKSQRADGSWPIDTNLSTWCSTLAANALPLTQLSTLNSQLTPWLLAQQYTAEHPYTHAAPGGWAWTDLPGGVPDADDTAGALLALAKTRSAERGTRNEEVTRAAEMGVRWLLDLQNRDGGIPTFCRGWGALPFDQSSADITAHAIRAWRAWQNQFSAPLQKRMDDAERKALRFLLNTQRKEGAWAPLWFGNEHAEGELNLVYGTARVLAALVPPEPESRELSAVVRGANWLLAAQNTDGGWGRGRDGHSSTEETALALESLSAVARAELTALPANVQRAELKRLSSKLPQALARGAQLLIFRVESGAWREPSPIGFYFAKLWYFEKLYPMIFTVAALRSVAESLSGPREES